MPNWDLARRAIKAGAGLRLASRFADPVLAARGALKAFIYALKWRFMRGG